MKTSSSLKDYLQGSLKSEAAANPKASQLTLVGPMFDNSHTISEPVIYVDRGAHFRKAHEGFSVGDNDSSVQPLDEVISVEKDYSDLAYALSFVGENFSQIEMWGFLGGRRDHELCNLGEVHSLLKSRTRLLKVLFDREIVAFSAGEWTFETFGTFSTFAFDPLHLTMSGDCKYCVSEEKNYLALSSQGVSNLGYGKVHIKTDAPLFVFFSDAEEVH